MDLQELNLEEAKINLVVDDLITAIKAATDNDGIPIFRSVERGLVLPNSEPREDNVPAVRIWHNMASVTDESVQLYASQTEYLISFFVACYSFDGTDLQQQRERLCRAMLKAIEYPEPSASGLIPQNFYWFNPQTIVIDHTSSLKRFSDSLVVLPPWYVTRIDLTVTIDTI